MEKFGVYEGFFQAIKPFCDRKMHQIDTEIVEKSKTFKFLSFYCNSCTVSEKFHELIAQIF